MPSSRDRQRKLARAKLDRQLARRAARARRRRQWQAGAGAALALTLIVVGAVWLAGGFRPDPEEAAKTQAGPCAWLAQPAAGDANIKDVGTPPTTGIPQNGTRPLTVTTNQGAPIVVTLDLAKAPCGAASLGYLAGKSFYDNTKCHEITADGALRCGDPSGTGLGGPTYTFLNENEPSPAPSGAPAAAPLYPKGTVAVVGKAPNANSSQFMIFMKDFTPPDQTVKFSVVGAVTGGQETLDKIAKIPTVDNGSGAKTKPKTDIVVQSVTVGEVAGGATAPSGAPSGAVPSAAAPSATSQS